MARLQLSCTRPTNMVADVVALWPEPSTMVMLTAPGDQECGAMECDGCVSGVVVQRTNGVSHQSPTRQVRTTAKMVKLRISAGLRTHRPERTGGCIVSLRTDASGLVPVVH